MKRKKMYSVDELRTIRKKVMTLAACLVKHRKYTRSRAMVIAWRMIKQRFYTKTVGVIFNKRQQAIRNLQKYDPRRIKVTLHHERNNPHDNNAIAVVVTVIGKGSYQIGYMKKPLAEIYVNLLNKGFQLETTFEGITGGGNKSFYGLNISYVIDQVAVERSKTAKLHTEQKKRASSRQEVRSSLSV